MLPPVISLIHNQPNAFSVPFRNMIKLRKKDKAWCAAAILNNDKTVQIPGPSIHQQAFENSSTPNAVLAFMVRDPVVGKSTPVNGGVRWIVFYHLVLKHQDNEDLLPYFFHSGIELPKSFQNSNANVAFYRQSPSSFRLIFKNGSEEWETLVEFPSEHGEGKIQLLHLLKKTEKIQPISSPEPRPLIDLYLEERDVLNKKIVLLNAETILKRLKEESQRTPYLNLPDAIVMECNLLSMAVRHPKPHLETIRRLSETLAAVVGVELRY